MLRSALLFYFIGEILTASVEYPTTLLGSRVMAENQDIDLNAWQKLDLLQDEASNEDTRAICYFAHKLQQAQSNPHLRVAVQAQLRSNILLPSTREEGIYSLER